MVDSRVKGARAETVVRDALRKLTGHQWERTPGSGALDPKHDLKGDLYIPKVKNKYVIEVKHYKDDHINSGILTNKSPQLLEWWRQAIRQGEQVQKLPLLIFKYDRSKLFAAYLDMPKTEYNTIIVCAHSLEFYVSLLEDWITNNNPSFVIP